MTVETRDAFRDVATLTFPETMQLLETGEYHTTESMSAARGVTGTAVRQASERGGAPAPDFGNRGRGWPWGWRRDREDVRAYLTGPEELAAAARVVRDRVGSISGGARECGVDRQTFQRVLRGVEWSRYETQLKVLAASRR